MVEHFGRKSHKDHKYRAQQIWQVLISMAHNYQITTYGRLATLIGIGGGGVLGVPLGHIAEYCNQNGLPPLTSIVVNEKTGRPGHGIPVKKSPTLREKVYKYDWFTIVPPTASELRNAYMNG